MPTSLEIRFPICYETRTVFTGRDFIQVLVPGKNLTLKTICISLEELASLSLANKKSSVTDQVFLFAQAARKLRAKFHPHSQQLWPLLPSRSSLSTSNPTDSALFSLLFIKDIPFS